MQDNNLRVRTETVAGWYRSFTGRFLYVGFSLRIKTIPKSALSIISSGTGCISNESGAQPDRINGTIVPLIPGLHFPKRRRYEPRKISSYISIYLSTLYIHSYFMVYCSISNREYLYIYIPCNNNLLTLLLLTCSSVGVVYIVSVVERYHCLEMEKKKSMQLHR